MARGVHTPRKNKNKAEKLLISPAQKQTPQWWGGDRDNIVENMSRTEKEETIDYLADRLMSATQQTETVREQMADADQAYKGEWKSPNADKDENIFIPKSREEVNSIKAYLISIISQLRPIVKMAPMGTSIIQSQVDEDYKRAKLNEAMFGYYWHDIWHALDDIVPRFLNHFLKYPMGVLKVIYREDDNKPDLRLELVDRAFLYLDPRANLFREMGWLFEEYFIPRSEAIHRIESGDWSMAERDMAELESVEQSAFNESNLKRFFGQTDTLVNPILEDEMVHCFDYWQFPRMGLNDAFGTVIGASPKDLKGGKLVRFGRNPFPYKGNPYVAASYNPDDRPDGQSLVELQKPFQKTINLYTNLRIADIRKNIRKQTFVMEQMFDETTMQDQEDGNSYVRLAKAWSEGVMADPNFDIRKFMFESNPGTSTGELITNDLPHIMELGQKSANLPDVFRGLDAQPGATLGQVQEQISRSSGQFTPVVRQVLRSFEQIAEISTSFFRSEDFYPENRIIRIIGKQSYRDALQGWNVANANTTYKSVSADDLDIDLIFDAISGADAIASKTLLMTSIERIMNAIGQIPQLFDVLRQEVDFKALFLQMVNVNGWDTEGFLLTDEEKQQQIKQAEQAERDALDKQRALQAEALQLQQLVERFQSELRIAEERNKQAGMAQKQIAVDTSRAMQDFEVKANLEELKQELDIEKMVTEITRKFLVEANLIKEKQKADEELMEKDYELEIKAAKQNKDVIIGQKSNDITVNKAGNKSDSSG